jgi:hypothetical protein
VAIRNVNYYSVRRENLQCSSAELPARFSNRVLHRSRRPSGYTRARPDHQTDTETTNPDVLLRALAQALQALTPKLTEVQVGQALDPILTQIGEGPGDEGSQRKRRRSQRLCHRCRTECAPGHLW